MMHNTLILYHSSLKRTKAWTKEEIAELAVRAISFRTLLVSMDVPLGKTRNYEKIRLFCLEQSIDTSHFKKRAHKTLEQFREIQRQRVLEDCVRKTASRKIKANRAKYIVMDSKQSDKKSKAKGLDRENDLTIEFVEKLIANGCEYCGETELLMIADRINNDLGHLQSNVKPACIRCNHIRGSMPFEAWMCLVPQVKEARTRGLFGNWSGPKRYGRKRTE